MKLLKKRRYNKMKNYIKLNGQKIELTDEQVKEIQHSLSIEQIKLADIPVGETFKIGKYEFIVLEHSKDTTAVILKDFLYENKKFGKDNDYKNSDIDVLCNDFANKISETIGAENLIEHTVDLTSDDGLKDYGKIRRRMSLLTTDLYRRYVDILDKYKVNKWWWLATAVSTPKHNSDNFVKCVSHTGRFDFNYCGYNYGVRPFCILKSDMLVVK